MLNDKSLIDRIIQDFPTLSNKTEIKSYTYPCSSKVEATGFGRIYAFYGPRDDSVNNADLFIQFNGKEKTTKNSTLAEIFSYNPNFIEYLSIIKLPYDKIPSEIFMGPKCKKESNIFELSDPNQFNDYTNSVRCFITLINKYFKEDSELNNLSLGILYKPHTSFDRSIILTKIIDSIDEIGIKLNGNFFSYDYEFDKSIDSANKAIEIYKRNKFAHFQLAKTLYQQGDKENALNYLRNAFIIDLDFKPAYDLFKEIKPDFQ